MLSYVSIITMLLFSTVGSIYDFKATAIDGKTINLSQYKGKNILIVNVASECGFTPQYAGLQKLRTFLVESSARQVRTGVGLDLVVF